MKNYNAYVMHCIKPVFKMGLIAGFLGLAVYASAQADAKVNSCMQQGRQAFVEQNYGRAVAIFEDCQKMDPENEEIYLSLAGIYMTQENLDEAEKYFNAALKIMPRTSPYLSYTYSMLGDIAYKRKQPKQALEMYNKSLEYNAANVNSLVGRGLVLEYDGEATKAAQSYQSASAVEPLNYIARNRLISLEPEYMNDEQILLALKQRYAVTPETTEITDEQRELFGKIHQMEMRRGVDYLKNRQLKVNSEQVVTINKNTNFSRDMLTLSGYNDVKKSVAQDAVNVFQANGIPLESVFELRDLTGEKIFTKESTLTEQGFFVYVGAVNGKKLYLLPGEAVPPSSSVKKKIAQTISKLKQSGYIEATAAEIKHVEEETKCSRQTLQGKLGLVVVPLTKKQSRYFVYGGDVKDTLASGAYYYVMLYRSQRNPRIEAPKNAKIEGYRAWSYTLCLENGELVYE